jgi:glucose uptake protein GlcU
VASEGIMVSGLMAGLLYSLGNFSAILAVTYLGHGTGFSFVKCAAFYQWPLGVILKN